MPSTADICKRALVTLIRALAVAYGFRVAVTRDATDQVIKRAYHTTSKRTHPDALVPLFYVAPGPKLRKLSLTFSGPPCFHLCLGVSSLTLCDTPA